MEFLNFNRVELLPNAKASAAFSADSGSVFREQNDIAPVLMDDRLSYMPWGADALAIGLVVGLAVAIYRLLTAEEKVSAKEKELSSIRQKAASKVAEERTEIDLLVQAAENERLSMEEREKTQCSYT